jgi:exonuclease VII large subunit
MAKNLQTVARRALTPCAAAEAFRFADGTLARDLADLRHAIATKSAHLVAHHRAEYHAWVERVLGDPALARRLERLARVPALRSDPEAFRRELGSLLDERLGKLRDRVL